MCFDFEGRRFGAAWANSKTQAEQKAALNALTELGLASKDNAGLVHLVDPEDLNGKLDLSSPSDQHNPE